MGSYRKQSVRCDLEPPACPRSGGTVHSYLIREESRCWHWAQIHILTPRVMVCSGLGAADRV